MLRSKTMLQDDISDSVGLLISILVRYPEVGTINYDPIRQQIKFTFILSGVLDGTKLDNFKKVMLNSIDSYNHLEHRYTAMAEINYIINEQFTMCEIIRDVDTLSQEEISMVIELVQGSFKQVLVLEKNDYLLEEDLLMQEEMIEHMLENIKASSPEKNLIAFREEGRVLVFNK